MLTHLPAEPTDASDNVARGVRFPKAASLIVQAFYQAEKQLMELADHYDVEEALKHLFGSEILSSSGALRRLAVPQPTVPAVPMVVTGSLQGYV